MTFYFNRETGQRVSKSTWTRSKAHGGSRFVRRSAKESKATTQVTPANLGAGEGASPKTGPSQSLRTWQDWENEAPKRLKKKSLYSEDFNYDNGVEYGTGVDY